MAKCFDVIGYIEPCNVVRDKYTGRGLLMTGRCGDASVNSDITFNQSGISVSQIAGKSEFFGELGLVQNWNKNGGKVLPVIIDVQNPFGVTVQGNTDSGRVSYTKTIPVTIPAIRDGKAEEFIMGLQKNNEATILILESSGIDNVGGRSNNDIFGAYSTLRLDPTSVTRSEYENGGAWTFNLVCEEPVPNVVCTIVGLEKALDEFNV